MLIESALVSPAGRVPRRDAATFAAAPVEPVKRLPIAVLKASEAKP